jgi:ABC-2 type transport system ATP-binding protein
MSAAIEAQGLEKRYRKTRALDGLDLVAESGQVTAVLGPNGAGKTTFVRAVATLLRVDAGSLQVLGHDVRREPRRVRRLLGLAGQFAAVEPAMSGRENLEMVARLYGRDRSAARASAARVLEQLDLIEPADRLVRTYSGGMRRRLDLAASLVARPPVLFLDEPTTGLDPKGRSELWEFLGERIHAGATLVLTTQYLEEADRLADDIVVLDRGRVAATGSPAELKARIGGERIVVKVDQAADLERSAGAVDPFADGPPSLDAEAREVSVPTRPGTRLIEVVRALDAAGVDAVDLQRREPTLDDVFLALTDNDEGPALEVAA